MRRDERGQAMAEFAVVMPMLALVTFGTIEVAIYLQQQSTLNVTAFLAARSASVYGGSPTQAKKAMDNYVNAAPGWVGGAVRGMKARKGGAGFDLKADTDRMTGLISAFTGGQVTGFDKLDAGASLPVEYDPKQHDNRKTGMKTRSLVDYREKATEQALASKAVSGARAAIDAVKQDVRWIIDQIKRLTPPPAPKPPPKPNNPTPNKPTPNKPGGGGTGGGGVVTPPKPAIELPDIKSIEALKPTGEAFNPRYAVMSNPTTQVGQITSIKYLSPKFEGLKLDDRAEWNAGTVAKGLQEAEANVKDGTGLQPTCDKLRVAIDKAAATYPGAGTALKNAFNKRVGAWVGQLTKGLDGEYKIRAGQEKTLFR